MIHDVEVQNDCFFERRRRADPAALHRAARLPLAHGGRRSWCWEGSSHSITTALRHAVSSTAQPMLYCDNGKDYLQGREGRDAGLSARNARWSRPSGTSWN